MRLSGRLNDHTLFITDARVGGRAVPGAAGRFAVTNPANGDVLAEVASLSADEAAEAVEIAREAQEAWRRVGPFERARRLRAWFEAVTEARDDLATLITAEMGKPFAEARGEAVYAASFIEWAAEEAKRLSGEVMASPFPAAKTMTMRMPVGVVAAITPWNFPAAMITRKVAPALAAGCAVVAKPAPETPLTALALAELATRAGVPDGLINVVTGEVTSVVPSIVGHPATAMVTFTGSTAVGKLLMRQAADGVRTVALELGGDAAFVVCEDADIDQAAAGVMAAKFRAGGQTCVAANRVIAVGAAADPLMDALEEKIAALTVGDGFERGVDVGPLIHAEAVARVEALMADARASGGQVRVGGEALTDRAGSFFAPTLVSFDEAPEPLHAREVFAPVANVVRARDDAHALHLANDTPYGLANYVYARDIGRVMRFVDGLESGMVGVNVGIVSHASAPFGGVKQSGLGREGGRLGVEEFTDVKYVVLGGLNA